MENESTDGIGPTLKRLREARALTQESLALAAGVPRSRIAALEGGRIANPGIETLLPLARALGVTLDDLAGNGRNREEK
jgi:transcriptional regulator with XRE-family HTH domain